VTVLMFLLNLVLIVLVLVCAYWLLFIGYFLMGGILYCLWVGLFAIAAVVGCAVSWHKGHDNVAVLLLLVGMILQGTWWYKWANKNNLVLWLHEPISNTYVRVTNSFSDIFKALHLRKPNPRNECPKCGSRKVKVVSERHSRYQTTGTFTRTLKHFSENGTAKGHTEEEYEAPATVDTTYRDMVCERCSHTWTNT